MKTLIYVNDGLAFILELLALFLWGRLAARMVEPRFFKVIAVVLVLALFVWIWGTFFSPKAKRLLPPQIYFPAKFLILALPAILFLKKQPLFSLLLILLLAVHLIIQWKWGRGDWNFF